MDFEGVKYQDLVAEAKAAGFSSEGRGAPSRQDLVEFLVAHKGADAVVAPKAKDDTPTISERIKAEPVRFVAGIGGIWVRNAKMVPSPSGGQVEECGLRVNFGDGNGGLSREFYPDLDEHDPDTNDCQCKHCLADVRKWIALDRHGLVKQYKIREFNPVIKAPPLPRWHTMDAAQIKEAHELAGFSCTIEEAIRYEQATDARADVIGVLDDLGLVVEDVPDEDLVSVELEDITLG